LLEKTFLGKGINRTTTHSDRRSRRVGVREKEWVRGREKGGGGNIERGRANVSKSVAFAH